MKYRIKRKRFLCCVHFFSVAVLVYFLKVTDVLTISTCDGLVAKSAMLIKQRRETGVNSGLDHICFSVPVHVFRRWGPAVNVR